MLLDEVQTPALLLDRAVLARNCRRMSERLAAAGVQLRPHLKTAKSHEVARLATAGHTGAITVSTLAEARYFLEGGFRDITYAVGMVPSKAAEVAALQRKGGRLTLLTDNQTAVQGLAQEADHLDCSFRLLIEIDSGGRRGGLDPEDPQLLALGRAIDQSAKLELAGVLTHAGHSYHCRGAEAVAAIAEEERKAVVRAAERLRAAGLDCATVSAGSTPTAVHARSFEGITELRPGVYVFNDLDQLGIGSCTREDIALSVLATVIGHNPRAGRILIDAGALALSKDVSAGEFFAKVGYGLVCDLDGRPLDGLYVAEVHQEHGLIAAASGAPPYDEFPVGRRLRILPNHACITAAAYPHYQVIDGGHEVLATWPRVNGW